MKQFWKIAAALIFGVACIQSTHADIIENFDGLAVGNLPGSDWSVKFATGSTQQNLATVGANGIGGTNGVVFDTSLAERNYHVVNKNGVTAAPGIGNMLILRSSFQLEVNDQGLPNQNAGFMGLQISTTPNWWDGSNLDFQLARRGANGQVLGTVYPNIPGFIGGWLNNSNFGLPANTNAAAGGTGGTGGWFDMQTKLTDNGSTYIAEYEIFDTNGNSIYTSPAVGQNGGPNDTGIASGTTLYGGVTTGWNNVSQDPITTINNVDQVGIDNFSFTTVVTTTVPEPSGFALLLGFSSFIAVRRRK